MDSLRGNTIQSTITCLKGSPTVRTVCRNAGGMTCFGFPMTWKVQLVLQNHTTSASRPGQKKCFRIRSWGLGTPRWPDHNACVQLLTCCQQPMEPNITVYQIVLSDKQQYLHLHCMVKATSTSVRHHKQGIVSHHTFFTWQQWQSTWLRITLSANEHSWVNRTESTNAATKTVTLSGSLRTQRTVLPGGSDLTKQKQTVSKKGHLWHAYVPRHKSNNWLGTLLDDFPLLSCNTYPCLHVREGFFSGHFLSIRGQAMSSPELNHLHQWENKHQQRNQLSG